MRKNALILLIITIIISGAVKMRFNRVKKRLIFIIRTFYVVKIWSKWDNISVLRNL